MVLTCDYCGLPSLPSSSETPCCPVLTCHCCGTVWVATVKSDLCHQCLGEDPPTKLYCHVCYTQDRDLKNCTHQPLHRDPRCVFNLGGVIEMPNTGTNLLLSLFVRSSEKDVDDCSN